jgi:mannose-6-phosphate isomerase-like protein (cupin superfamily)
MASEMQSDATAEDFETPAAQAQVPKLIKYSTPVLNRPKGIVPLCRSDILTAAVQVIKKGGENNLHSHAGMDGFWFVLKGKARFYGERDVLLGEFGPMEGVFIPRGVSYWFESAGEEMLELLQVEAFARGIRNVRTDVEPKKAGQKNFQVFDPDGRR